MAKVFLAEDDPLMSRMYGRILKATGYELGEATDGEMAIKMLREMNPKPDIVILDVMMPNKNGFDVLATMKGDQDLKNIPVILLSNLSSKEDEQKGLELGAVTYMIKSEYTPKQVAEKVKEILEKK